MKLKLVFISITILLISCGSDGSVELIEKFKTEVREVEREFAELVEQQGMKAGFVAFASDDAVIKRNEKLIKGKQAIADFYDQSTLRDVKLEWEPEFVDVATSGDLAYTWGPYTFEAIDVDGNTISVEGNFHTVWRRQADGKWRYVWD